MTISSGTPEGDSHRCPVCGELVVTDRSEPQGDSVCPRCGALLSVVSDQLGIDRQRINPSTSFTELGVDSLDTVEVVMELEEEFDIHIPDEEAEKIQTVADAIRAILRRRNQFPGDWTPENR
jgi:acyl carrier protein